MKLHWTCLTDYVGIGYGYSTHQKRLFEGLQRQGVEMTENSDVAVHLTTVDTFRPVPGKFNILYSMYECLDLPDTWIAPLEKADLIIVPCSYNKKLFSRYTKKPIEVCLEGVEVDKFTFYDRKFPDNRPFVFLWFGATNPRKGTEYTMIAWELWNKLQPKEVRENSILVMKTTQEGDRKCGMTVTYKQGSREWEEDHTETLPAERVVRVAGNAFVDTRRLPVIGEPRNIEIPGLLPENLVELYHYAHCFLLPTRGEGFGLTLAEAAATGCPCVYTPWSGPADFMSKKTGYPLQFSFAPVKTVNRKKKPGGGYQNVVSHETRAAHPDTGHLYRRMVQVYKDYENALKRGKAAAEHIRKYITWDKSAQSFMKIVEKYTGQKAEVAA